MNTHCIAPLQSHWFPTPATLPPICCDRWPCFVGLIFLFQHLSRLPTPLFRTPRPFTTSCAPPQPLRRRAPQPVRRQPPLPVRRRPPLPVRRRPPLPVHRRPPLPVRRHPPPTRRAPCRNRRERQKNAGATPTSAATGHVSAADGTPGWQEPWRPPLPLRRLRPQREPRLLRRPYVRRQQQ